MDSENQSAAARIADYEIGILRALSETGGPWDAWEVLEALANVQKSLIAAVHENAAREASDE